MFAVNWNFESRWIFSWLQIQKQSTKNKTEGEKNSMKWMCTTNTIYRIDVGSGDSNSLMTDFEQ